MQKARFCFKIYLGEQRAGLDWPFKAEGEAAQFALQGWKREQLH